MLLVLMLGMSMKATAQARMVDSLKRELEKKNITVEKQLELYDALLYITWEHDAASGIEFGKKGIALAKKQDHKKWLSILYSHTAMSYFYLTQYDSVHY